MFQNYSDIPNLRVFRFWSFLVDSFHKSSYNAISTERLPPSVIIIAERAEQAVISAEKLSP